MDKEKKKNPKNEPGFEKLPETNIH